jgi:alkanesulfonate monooxygenase SsuD/methylene tetrahydromethanopterin reductase-like flavin-dependent oxidoreductase (luciferase family)
MSQRNKRPLKVGLMLAIGGGLRWSELKAMAQHAEAVGFDSLWLPDHLLFDLGGLFGQAGERRTGPWECWSVLASLAAITTRVDLGTIVACTAFRNPALLAKMADTVDEISSGRLILGLGGGAAWNEVEFRAYGYPFDHLVGRFEEALQIIHPLLRTGAVDFRGKYYSAMECELQPRGPRPGGPPILIGAHHPRMFRLLAQYADFWNGYGVTEVEHIAPLREAVDAACIKAGRDPATLERTIMLLVDLPGSESGSETIRRFRSGTWAADAYPWLQPPATGTPDELAELLRAFAREGVSHIQLWLEPNTRAGVDAFAPILERLDQA